MHSSSDKTIEHLLREHILSLFSLPDGNVIWQGSGELTTQSYVYYFCINDEDYLLVNESHHGANDNALRDVVIGNAVAPHQQIASIPLKEGPHAYVNLSNKEIATAHELTGDFSVFRILG